MFNLIELTEDQAEKEWDANVEETVNHSIFHRMRFLRYHEGRFDGCRYIFIRKGSTFYGAIAINISKGIAKSPFGASYGSFTFLKAPTYHEGKVIAGLFLDYLTQNNIHRCELTPLPGVLCQVPMDTFAFNLLEVGFEVRNRDITNIVGLKHPFTLEDVPSKTRNILRKSETYGIKIARENHPDRFWKLLELTYQKHGTHPTHTLEELCRLERLCPGEIFYTIGSLDEEPIAGMATFVLNSRSVMAFYLAQNDAYKRMNALTLVIYQELKESAGNGYQYFDFGTSSAEMTARENIFRFKEGFGANGYFRDRFILEGPYPIKDREVER